MIKNTDRCKGIIDFQYRILDTVLKNEIHYEELPLYISIILSNIIDFITKFINKISNKDKDKYVLMIENLFDLCIDYLYDYISKYNHSFIYSFDNKNYNKSNNIYYYNYINDSIEFIDNDNNIIHKDILWNSNIINDNINISLNKINASHIRIPIFQLIKQYNYYGETDLMQSYEIKNNMKKASEIKDTFIIAPPYNLSNDEFIKFKNNILQLYTNYNIICIKSPILFDNKVFEPLYHKYNGKINNKLFINNKEIESIYEIIDSKDNQSILFENPYITYDYVIGLVRDILNKKNKPKAIFITIYRHNNIIPDLLCKLSQLGIKVYVYIEIMARGDEENNIKIINKLKENNINIINMHYAMKVHSKAILIIYDINHMNCHISTGNYNTKSANLYTDYQFISNNIDICKDLFNFFSTLILQNKYIDKKEYFNNNCNLLISPITSKINLTELINNSKEIDIKSNNLCDKLISNELLDNIDSNIRIISRTSCSIPTTDNIKIRSKVGNLLEHGRLYRFDNQAFIGSADLLFRNMNNRIELLLRLPENIKIYSNNFDNNGISKAESISDYFNRIWESSNWEMDYNGIKWNYRKKK